MEESGVIDLNEIPIFDDDKTHEDAVHENVEDLGVGQQTPSVQENSSNRVDELTEPIIGMSFDSGEEFATFCHDYAYCKGFTLFSRTTTLLKEYKEMGITRTGTSEPMYYMMERIRLCCKCGGRKKSEGSNVTGCKVFVEGRIENGNMIIKGAHLEHNHPLEPRDSPIMVNYRCVDDSTAHKINVNDKAGVPITKNFNCLLVDSGSHENLQFNKQDVRNVIKCQRLEARIQGDALALENYFKSQREYNADFFYAIQRDQEGRLLNAFWYDARSRAMFKEFGDVITFDTTFLCNRYRMPFAPFVGVNHHGKSIVFAAALISLEDAETFVWVFNQWLKCMGKAPLGILTDQCRAIGKVVQIVFPEIPHRLCLWHILQNASRNASLLRS